LTDIERLIEALEYAEDMGIEWWEVFDTKIEAEDILCGASKEEIDEYNIVQIINLVDDEDFFTTTPQNTFEKCLKTLKRRMNRNS